jgi:rubrerythrin
MKETLEDYRDYLFNNWILSNKRKHLKTIISKEDYNNIVNQLKELDISLPEFKYFLTNSLPFELPKCKLCNNAVRSHRRNGLKWSNYCSKKCLQNSPEQKAKLKQTNLNKYGVEYVSQLDDIKTRVSNSVKETNLKRYGVTSTAKLTEVKNKIKETCIKRYGVKSNLIIKDNLNKRIDESYNNLLNKTMYNPNAEIIPLFTRDDYQGTQSKDIKYKWLCKNCGEIFDGDYYESQLPRCLKCNPLNISKGHKEVVEFLESLNVFNKILINDKTIITPLELDIFIPEINTAIEFNGDYWHSLKDKYYHINKTKLCEEKGIKLIHIFEWEWNKKKDLVKLRLNNLNKHQTKIYARNCSVKEIDNKTSKEFQSNYHLQDSITSKVNLGLFYNDKLISVMTFGKPRFNKNYEWELLRFCSNEVVIGGAGKLLKYFEKHYKPNNLISYANRCWSSKLNNVYEKIGFKLINESEPNYVYIYNDIIIPRYQAQKHKLKDLLGEENFNPNLSEEANMLNNKFVKVYDCGNLIFVKTYNNI